MATLKPIKQSNGAYWIGADGNVYVKGHLGTNSAGRADANTANYWGSRGFNQIADPVARPGPMGTASVGAPVQIASPKPVFRPPPPPKIIDLNAIQDIIKGAGQKKIELSPADNINDPRELLQARIKKQITEEQFLKRIDELDKTKVPDNYNYGKEFGKNLKGQLLAAPNAVKDVVDASVYGIAGNKILKAEQKQNEVDIANLKRISDLRKQGKISDLAARRATYGLAQPDFAKNKKGEDVYVSPTEGSADVKRKTSPEQIAASGFNALAYLTAPMLKGLPSTARVLEGGGLTFAGGAVNALNTEDPTLGKVLKAGLTQAPMGAAFGAFGGRGRLSPTLEQKIANPSLNIPTRLNPNQAGGVPIGKGKAPSTPKGVPKKGFETEVNKIMKQDGIGRKEATAKLDAIIRRDTAPGLDIGYGSKTTPPPPRLQVTGKPRKNPAVAEVLTGVSKARGASSTEGSLVASSIATKAKKLGVKLDEGFTYRYQTGTLNGPAEQQLGKHIKGITDKLFEKQKILDPTIKYRKNYVPQAYAQADDVVEGALRNLQKNTGAASPRKFNTYAEAGEYGLTPKNKTIDAIIGDNATTVRKVAENRQLVDKGLKSGIFSTDHRGGVQVQGITDKAGNPLFAQPEVAKTLNGVMQKDPTGLGKALHKTARGFETTQDILLQGGIPGTNANFFVAGQAIKDTTRNIGKLYRPIQAAKQEGHLIGDFFRGKMKTQKRFSEGTFKANGGRVKNSEFVGEMAKRGLYIQPQTSLSGTGANAFRRGWRTLGNNPTFGRYMPNRLLSTSQEVYSQSVKKLGHQKALDLAADTTKKFQGHVDTILKGRSNTANDIAGVALFAPKYRESIIGALRNVLKSAYPKNWMDPSYAPSRQLLTGMGVILGAYELLNRELTGHSMMENRPGQELSLEIEYGEPDENGNKKVINAPFMPGFMTVPRAIAGAISSIFKGDPKGVVKEGTKALSAPLAIGGNVLSNRDYFDRPIYVDEKVAREQGVDADNPLNAFAKVGTYVAGQVSPAWVRGGIGAAQGKPLEQNIAVALEAPIRFGTKVNKNITAYYEERDNARNTLNTNQKAKFDTINPTTKNILGQKIKKEKSLLDGAEEALILQNEPDVLKAQLQMYRNIAKRTGEAIDPLYSEDLSDKDRDVVLKYTRLNSQDPGSGTAAKIFKDNKPMLEAFYDKRGKFFDDLFAKNPDISKKAEEERKKAGIPAFPNPSKQLEARVDKYNKLTGDSKYKYLADNPDISKFFDEGATYKAQKRKLLGLPLYDEYPEMVPKVKAMHDKSNALPETDGPKGGNKSRYEYLKKHPALIAQWTAQNIWSLQDESQISIFRDEQLTQKQMGDISQLAKNLVKNKDGTYSFTSDGNSGSGSGSGSGGGGSKGPSFIKSETAKYVKPPSVPKITVRRKPVYKSGGTKKLSVKNIPTNVFSKKLS